MASARKMGPTQRTTKQREKAKQAQSGQAKKESPTLTIKIDGSPTPRPDDPHTVGQTHPTSLAPLTSKHPR